MSLNPAALLLEQFDHLLTTPEAVEELNRTILTLAVQGKLVEQDPQDEPASNLLKRIKTTRAEFISKGLLSKGQPLPSIKLDDIPFELPAGWEWVRLGEIVQKIGSGSTPKGGKQVYQDSGIKFIRSQNVWNDGLRLDGVAFISESINYKMSESVVKAKDILLNITGASIARSALVPDDFDIGNVNQHVSIIRLIEPELRQFIHLCIISPYVYNLIMSVQVGISREGLSMGRLREFILPIPPLTEQKRIVARVEALFAKTRQLAERLARAQHDLAQLNQAALARLLAAETPEDFARQWAFIAENFDSLFTEPEHIVPLRQAILELAVRGKLTCREPTDEPASTLLAHIQAERAKVGKVAPLSPVKASEQPFDLPEGWVWARLDQIAEVGTGSTPSRGRPDYYEKGTIPWITSSATNQPFISAADEYITDDAFRETRLRLYPKHTLVVALYGQGKTRGQISELLIEATVNQACAAIVLEDSEPEIRSYIKLFFLKNYQELRSLAEGGAQPNLNVGKVKAVYIPLPPLAEQKRIVAKVEHLLRLCDTLEAKLRAAREARSRLAAAVLAGVGNGAGEN